MISQSNLDRLEESVGAVLDGDETAPLNVLGYGEISTVLLADGTSGPVAAKRLPVMTRSQLDDYRHVLDTYVTALEEGGVAVVPSEVHAVGADPVVPYCVQPLQPRLLVDELTTAHPDQVAAWVEEVVARVCGVTDGSIGIDGQLSNWAIDDGDSLLYLDVTTPLLRDSDGREQCDLDLFIASLPWALRAPVRRFLLGEILSHYYAPRPVLIDAAGNLIKEKLVPVINPLLIAANVHLDEPITEGEARRYYRSDARMWALLQRLRRTDRWWQRNVRRRRYPFLLPGKIER